MAQRMNTNPWGDVFGSMVNAYYKDIMSRPTAADMMKQQLVASQLEQAPLEADRLRLANQMSQRQYDMGGYTGMPSTAQEYLMAKQLEKESLDEARRYENLYVTKPQWQDFGDVKMQMGVHGPIQGRTVGRAPAWGTLNGQFVEQEAIPSRPIQSSPMALTASQYTQPSAPVPQGPAANMMTPDVMQSAGIIPVTEEYLNAPMTINGRVSPPSLTPPPSGIQLDTLSTSPDVTNNTGSPQPAPAQGPRVITAPPNPEDVIREGNKSFSTYATQNDLNNTFASILYNIEKGGAGFGSILKDIPLIGGQTAAGVLEKDLDKLSNKAALDKIAQYKEESKTGGFFGNLSEGERFAVLDSVVAIKQSMGPKELAYRVMMHQDLVNDIVHGRGKMNPITGEMIPLDAGAPRTGLPTMKDIQNAQSSEELMRMWDAFDKYSVFEGRPPKMIDDALARRMKQVRGGM